MTATLAATLSAMQMVYHRSAKYCSREPGLVGEYPGQAVLKRTPLVKEVPMLALRHRSARNPMFHFHPLHTGFSVLAALILFGMMTWILAVPAK